jgi:hypothetical protein
MSSDQIAWVLLVGLVVLIIIGFLWMVVPQELALRRMRKSQKVVENALKDAQSIEGLLPLLKNSNSGIRKQAAQKLGRLGDKRAVEALLAVLTDDDTQVRYAVVQALGELRNDRATPQLTLILNDKLRGDMFAAVEALGKIASQQAVDALVAALEPSSSVSEFWARRKAAATVLHRLRWLPANDVQLKNFTDALMWGIQEIAVRRDHDPTNRNQNYYYAQAQKILSDLIIIYFAPVQGNQIDYQKALEKLAKVMANADTWFENYATNKNVTLNGMIVRWQEVKIVETNEDRSVFDGLLEYEIRRISEDMYCIVGN